jgi:hypothetical protein
MIRKSSLNVLSLEKKKMKSSVVDVGISPLTAFPSGLRKITKFVREPLEVVSQQQECA